MGHKGEIIVNVYEGYIVRKTEETECYICSNNAPLYYLCKCKTLGRCAECVRDMYKNGQHTCPTCNSRYSYRIVNVEVISWNAVIKEYSLYALRVFIAALTLFLSVGFTYNEIHIQQMTYCANNYNIIIIIVCIIACIINAIIGCFWLVAIFIALEDDYTMLNIKYQNATLCFAFMSQLLGVTIISTARNIFMFNIFTYVIGSSIMAVVVLIIFIGYRCRKYTKENYSITKPQLVL